MTLRRRLTLVSALAVALAIVLASAIVYVVVRGQLRGEVDDTLRERTRAARVIARVQEADPGMFDRPPRQRDSVVPLPEGAGALRLPPPPLESAGAVAQLVSDTGVTQLGPFGSVSLPVSARTREVAAGQTESFFTDTNVNGVELRVLTVPTAPGTALQVARPLTETNKTLDDLLLTLLAVSVGGIGLAALLAGRIAGRFSSVVEALERSVGAQRRLVADASHELRTPITSLRTNIETLARAEGVPDAERTRILAGSQHELEEMSDLVADLVDLAREGAPDDALETSPVRLDSIVADAVERTRRRYPEIELRTELRPSVIPGDAERIGRAVSNLLDNALKFGPNGGPVEVGVADGGLTVRDHGPGIDEADLPRIFDRFYRASAARGKPGSGLGLAIVKHTAELHGAALGAENAPGGGARLELRFPGHREPERVDS